MEPYFVPPMQSPKVEEIKTINGGHFKRFSYSNYSIENTPIRPYYTDVNSWSFLDNTTDIRKYFESEEYKNMEIKRKKSYHTGEYSVTCNNENDLASGNILKTLSAMKGKLMLDINPIHISKIECMMTPLVRQIIIESSKKLKRYGKKRPIIARFDEYGNRLPDEMDLGANEGITLKIIDPEIHGPLYIELKAIEFTNKMEYAPENEGFLV